MNKRLTSSINCAAGTFMWLMGMQMLMERLPGSLPAAAAIFGTGNFFLGMAFEAVTESWSRPQQQNPDQKGE